jgi:hypothetical protein
MTTFPSVSHSDIAHRAHQIWQEAGHPDGNDTAHWLQAEKELNALHAKAAGANGVHGTSAIPAPAVKHVPERSAHSANYAHPGVTTDSLHHQRNR